MTRSREESDFDWPDDLDAVLTGQVPVDPEQEGSC